MAASSQVTFRGMESSPAVRTAVEKKIEKLDRVCGCLTSCRVVIEAPHRHHHKGRLFHVRIDMTLPGKEIVINRDHHQNRSHEDVYVAVRDAFDAARDKVEEYVRRRKNQVKTHGRAAREGTAQTPDTPPD